MLSYLDYLMFLHAVFCTEQLYGFRRIIFSLFLRKKKLKITCQFCMGFRLNQNKGSSKCSHISTIWCFCTRFFAQNNSMGSLESLSACFCEKKKLKITCPFCMGFRLTKMEDLQNALISRLFLHAVFCTEQLYGFRRMIFSIFCQKKS